MIKSDNEMLLLFFLKNENLHKNYNYSISGDSVFFHF